MAETTRTVSLVFAAELDQFKRQMAEIPNISDKEAKQAARRIETALNRAEASAKKAAKSSRQAADKMGQGFKGAAEAAGDFDSGIQAVAGALDKVSPELADAARAAGDLAGAFEGSVKLGRGMIAVLAPIGAALAAGAGAWVYYNKQLADADAKLERVREELNQQIALHRQVKEAAILAAVASGDMTQEQADGFFIAQKGSDLFAERLQTVRDEIATLQTNLSDEEKELQKTSKTLNAHNSLHGVASTRIQTVSDNTAVLRDQLAAKRRELELVTAAQERYTASLKKQADAAAAATAAAAASDAAADAAAADEARRAAMDAALEGIRQEEAEARRIREEAAQEQFERLTKIRERQKAEALRIAQEEAAQEAAIQAATLDTATAVAGAVGDLAGVVAQRNTDAALEAYRVQQALGLTQVVINTAAAITRALAELGPVAGGIASAGIVATGAAQAAIIASAPPPAHVGERVVGNAFGRSSPGRLSDEQDRRLLTGERVLSRSEAAAMDRPVEIRVVQQLRHKAVDEMLYRNARTAGSRTRQTLGRRPGHRSR